MPRPTARVLALLEILQAGGTHTVAELAGRLEVDERTVRRYVEHLADLDIPVTAIRGRYGGYQLSPGYRMPPLMLTDSEALAVLLGLLTGRRTGAITTSATITEAAMAKVRRALPRTVRARLDALIDVARFTAQRAGSATDATDTTVTTSTGILLTIAEAIRDARPVELDYTDASGRASRRSIHPYGLVAHRGRWYVTGPNPTSGGSRTFRVDRIDAARPGLGHFVRPADFDAPAAVLTGLAEAPHPHRVVVLVDATPEQVRAVLPASVATIDERLDGALRLRLRVEDLGWLPARLAALDRPFSVEEPDELRDLVAEFATRLARYAEPQDGPDELGHRTPADHSMSDESTSGRLDPKPALESSASATNDQAGGRGR